MLGFFADLSPVKKRLVLLVIIYIGFISLGLPDGVLGVAWSQMRLDFDRPMAYAGFITMLLTCCSAVSSFSSGYILRKLGTGRLLTICGFVTGLSLLGYAWSPAFWCVLLLAIPLGFGQGAVDTGMNFYVAKHYTSRDMNWLHCCWGIGASSGPGLVTLLLAFGLSWRWGYALVGSVQVALACLFLLTLGLWREPESVPAGETAEKVPGSVKKDLRFWCCPVMFWLYTGMEAGVGLWGYVFLTTCRGVSPEVGGLAVTAYWGMLTAGRFVVGFLANRLGNSRQIRYSLLLAFGCGLLMLIPGLPVLSFVAVALTGFALAAFYPAMMHAAPEYFDETTAATVIGFQGGGGMLGTATIPVAFGFLATRFSFELLPYLVLLASILILLLHSRLNSARAARN